jgi:hypothetical protein
LGETTRASLDYSLAERVDRTFPDVWALANVAPEVLRRPTACTI